LSDLYDVAIIGASIAGCTAAILLARQGARVALIDRKSDPHGFKKICTHYLQPSAVPTVERLGLAPLLLDAGAARPSLEIWTPSGWIYEPEHEARTGLNIRREKLDPLLRDLAVGTPGVELFLGHTFRRLLRTGGRVTGLVTIAPKGGEVTFDARLVVGADGRQSRVAEDAGVRKRVYGNNRVAFFSYFRGLKLAKAGVAQAWYANPDVALVFPTDNDVAMVSVMPKIENRSDWNTDRERKFTDLFQRMPDAPALGGAERIAPILGMMDMPIVWCRATLPGLALVGDAAFAPDPIWGVGCGWAFQSAEWLADCVGGSLSTQSALDRALKRYRSRHRWRLAGHAMHMANYASGRPFYSFEKLLFTAATTDRVCASRVHAFGHRTIGVGGLMSPLLFSRALVGNLMRRRLAATPIP
jgi:menaquinone-9 beta-reductase